MKPGFAIGALATAAGPEQLQPALLVLPDEAQLRDRLEESNTLFSDFVTKYIIITGQSKTYFSIVDEVSIQKPRQFNIYSLILYFFLTLDTPYPLLNNVIIHK